MARKRVAVTGRFVKEGEEKPVDETTGKATKEAAGRRVGAPRPRHCRTFARARFAEALPEIADTLLEQARKGSVAHLKLLVQLSGLDRGDLVPKAAKRRGKSLEAILMDEWSKEPGTGTAG